MYTETPELYDAIYTSVKDYADEARQIHAIIRQHCANTDRASLLDVACGTGLHLEHLRAHYTCTGLDLDAGLLTVAHRRCPDVPLIEDNMLTFDLGRTFDVITCLFSAIGYVKTLEGLRQAAARLAAHLAPSGVLIIEPWFSPEAWRPNTPHATLVDQPELKIARLTVSELIGSEAEGWRSRNVFHYLVATPDGVQHFVEPHELGLFTQAQYMAALEDAGLSVIHDADGLIGRGLYIAQHANQVADQPADH